MVRLEAPNNSMGTFLLSSVIHKLIDEEDLRVGRAIGGGTGETLIS